MPVSGVRMSWANAASAASPRRGAGAAARCGAPRRATALLCGFFFALTSVLIAASRHQTALSQNTAPGPWHGRFAPEFCAVPIGCPTFSSEPDHVA